MGGFFCLHVKFNLHHPESYAFIESCQHIKPAHERMSMNRVTITSFDHAGPGRMNAYTVKIIDVDRHIGARVPVLATSQAEAGQVAWACFDRAIDKRGRVDLAKLGAV